MYEKLINPKNVNTGMADHILFAPVSFFDTDGIKGPLTGAGTTLANRNVISADHDFLVGKGFIRLDTAPFKNEMNSSSIGEVGSKSLDHHLTVNVLGNYEELHASMSLLLNERCIILIGGVNCVNEPKIQIGTACVPAFVESMEWTTGTLKDGQKGYNIDLNSVSDGVYLYEGQVTEMPTSQGGGGGGT